MYHLNLSEQVCVCDITLFDMMSSSCVLQFKDRDY